MKAGCILGVRKSTDFFFLVGDGLQALEETSFVTFWKGTGTISVVVQSLSRVRRFVTTWTIAQEAPLSMEFSRQEYWSDLSFPSPGDLPDLGTELMSLGRWILSH